MSVIERIEISHHQQPLEPLSGGLGQPAAPTISSDPGPRDRQRRARRRDVRLRGLPLAVAAPTARSSNWQPWPNKCETPVSQP